METQRKIWIKSNLRKPAQGKKILCFNKGDLSIRQRFKDFWFPIPYIDSSLADINEPELWQEIDFPVGFTGMTRVFIDDKLLTMDEMEKEYPDQFDEFVMKMNKHFIDTRK